MLVTMKELLLEADKNNYAVGAFNCSTLENIRAVIKAAEKTSSPVIMEYAEAHKSFIPIEEIGPIMVDYAKRAKVPVAVHLDHGQTYETFVKAIKLGFTSVMIDASSLPFEENVAKTKEIVKLAHSVGVTVEAELGHVFNSTIGAGEGSTADTADDYEDLDAIYTNPDDAKKFVDQTGVDCLAIAFGTVHGVYLKEPKLDLPRIKKIKEKVNIPLVMHGGSGVVEEDYRTAIENGIRKINYYTYANKAAGAKVRDYINGLSKEDVPLFDHISSLAIDALAENVEGAMNMFKHRK
jgi:fructose-bisphosphate aldolase class II